MSWLVQGMTGGELFLGNRTAQPGLRFAVTRAAMRNTTGTQDITVPDFGTVKAARVIVTKAVTNDIDAADSNFSVGMTDGTTQFVNSGYDQDGVGTTVTRRRAKTGSIVGVSSGGSWVLDASATLISNGIRLNVTATDGVARLVQVILYGGDGLSAYVTTTAGATVGNTVTVTPGFETNAILMATCFTAMGAAEATQMSYGLGVASWDGSTIRQSSLYRLSGSAASFVDVQAFVSGNSIITSTAAANKVTVENVTSTSFDLRSNGINFNTVEYGFLCLGFNGGGEAYAGLETGPTTTGSFTFSSPNFQPDYVEFIMSRVNVVDTLLTDARADTIGIAAFTASSGYVGQVANDDGATISDATSFSTQAPISLKNGNQIASVFAELLTGTLTAMAATGPNINFTTVTDTSRLLPMLAIRTV